MLHIDQHTTVRSISYTLDQYNKEMALKKKRNFQEKIILSILGFIGICGLYFCMFS
jgi:hypothetical protein